MTDPTLRVVTLNAGSLLEPGWLERRVELVTWLDELDADVVCLQETWQDDDHPCSAEWVVDQSATDWHWVFGGCPFPEWFDLSPSIRFGSTILSRWPIDDHTLHTLPVDADPAVDHPAWRMELELLHAYTGGLHLFSTHLAPAPAQAYHRIRQVLFIDDVIQAAVARTPSTMVPILCGDFNAEPESDEIRYLCSLATIDGRSTYYQDAWRSGARTDPGYTGDPRTNPLNASFNVPPKRIDYVFVGDPFLKGGAGVVHSVDLAFHEPRTGLLASDHYGLVVDVGWPARPDRPDDGG